MSAAAPPLRSRRGPRRCLPLVLGLALLTVTIGVEPGAARSADSGRPAAVGQAGPVTTPERAGQETDGSAEQNLRPAAAPVDRPAPPPVADRQRPVPPTRPALISGDAPVPGDPRAPPLPVA